MTEIAIPDQQPTTGVDLELWARQATAAAVYAEGVCSTTMAPAAYRGKPAEAAAAILAGKELGFSPMASLRAFDNIQGTPAPKAMTLRAVVQAAGHEVRIVESTDERAVVGGRRKSDTEWQTSIWDIERARKFGLLDKAKNASSNPWITQPAAMLVARATAEVCRWIASDAIMGMPYAAEEVGDFADAAPAPTARRVTVAELEAMDSLDEVARAAQAGEIKIEMLTDEQRKRIFALWGELGFAGDANREQRLAITAKILGLPELESSSDLTRAEADQVIAALIERKERTAQTADGGEG